MGIVKISEDLHKEARVACKAMSRSINAQVEHWIKIGMFIEENPNCSYADACQHLMEQARLSDQAQEQGQKKRAG